MAPAAIQAGVPVKVVPTLLEGLANHAPVSSLLKIPGITPNILEVVESVMVSSFAKTFRLIYLVSLAFGGLAIIFAFSLDGEAFDSKLTDAIARKLQHGSVLHGVVDERHDTEKVS